MIVIWSRPERWTPLLLSRVVRNADGSIKSGYVVNGEWNFELRNGECLAKDGKHIVNRWSAPEKIEQIEVPRTMHGKDYDAIIEWAEAQLKGNT